jgi:hypothetical protein
MFAWVSTFVWVFNVCLGFNASLSRHQAVARFQKGTFLHWGAHLVTGRDGAKPPPPPPPPAPAPLPALSCMSTAAADPSMRRAATSTAAALPTRLSDRHGG